MSAPDIAALRAQVADWLSNEGDGGIWESLDRKNSEVLARAIVGSSWLTPLLAAAEEAERLRERLGRWEASIHDYENAAHAARAELAAIREGVTGLLSHYHADTCASVLYARSGYDCNCWRSELRALLGEGGER